MGRQSTTIFGLLAIFVAFANGADLVSTYYLIEHGLAREANPVALALIEYSWIAFVVCKIAVGCIATVALWLVCDHIVAQRGLIFLATLMACLMGWHAYVWSEVLAY